MGDKTVVITGAGSGLGRAIAMRLAANGETVVLLGRTLAKVQAVADTIGARAHAIACDVSDPGSVRLTFAAIAERHGRIDVLINNAAIFVPFALEEGSEEMICAQLNTNLLGPILCARAAVPLLRAAGGGLVISISSESVERSFAWLSVYEASKAGLERFMTALRRELKADNIRVSTLRLGSLIDPERQLGDPEFLGRFMRANALAGVDLMQSRSSRLNTVADVICSMIDLPADTGFDLVTLSGRDMTTG
jgi:meso-butanediol dehydrogenase / (S,S)-butanediol dehydrogenase / diacetyl reductase